MDNDLLNKIFLTNLFGYLPPVYSYFLCCLGAIIAGTVIGVEREKAQKAAGLRTFAMVALGSCVFTLTTRLMLNGNGNVSDIARIPAQIVSGVGFLGAGAVFRSGRMVSGLTTAAGIWATAAVGVVFGLGFFMFGICITFMIFALLWIQSLIERRNLNSAQWENYHIHVDIMDGKGPIVLEEILQDWGHRPEIIDQAHQSVNVVVWQLRLCPNHRSHQRFLSDLAGQPSVLKVVRHSSDYQSKQ